MARQEEEGKPSPKMFLTAGERFREPLVVLARRSGAAGGERARARESGGAARLLLGAVLGSCGSGGRGAEAAKLRRHQGQ